MSFKRDVEKEMSMMVGTLRRRGNHSSEELNRICSQMPVGAMKSPKLFCRFLDTNGLSLLDGASLLVWLEPVRNFIMKLEVEPCVTYHDVCQAYDRVQCHVILIHRLNHMLHDTMIEVYDMLEREKRLKMSVKRWSRKSEESWNAYFRPRMRQMEDTAWCTLQDHFVIASDMVKPKLEMVYEALRNYMIRLGWRDVELKARCCVALLMGKVAGSTFLGFFEEAWKLTGIDFSKCFSDADLQPMVRIFAGMCDALGIKVRTDKHGRYELDGFDPEASQRFQWAWEELMSVLCDNDLMDESVLRAFELNPSVNEEYQAVLEEERQKDFEQGLQKLGEKYNVIQAV